MNYTQNEKIEQVTDSTMVVGIDIGSQIHYARAFDNRGRELTKRIFLFITIWKGSILSTFGLRHLRLRIKRLQFWSAASQQVITGLRLRSM